MCVVKNYRSTQFQFVLSFPFSTVPLGVLRLRLIWWTKCPVSNMGPRVGGEGNDTLLIHTGREVVLRTWTCCSSMRGIRMLGLLGIPVDLVPPGYLYCTQCVHSVSTLNFQRIIGVHFSRFL